MTWDTSSYEETKENAEYTFSGTVTLPSKVTNDNNIPLTATITVTVGSGAVIPPVEHKHCVCGGTENIGDHTSHSDVTYQPLDSSFTGGDLAAGNYYLTEDITLNYWMNIRTDVNLCLNGHTIYVNDKKMDIYSSEFNITDCIRIGSIKGNAAYIFYHNTGTTNIFGGDVETTSSYAVTIEEGKVNVYGGSVKASAAGIVVDGGILNIYDGKITRVWADNSAVVNIAGGMIQATSPTNEGVKLSENSILHLGGKPHISTIGFGKPNQVSATCGGQGYTGEIILLCGSPGVGDVIVSNVTKGTNDTKFALNSDEYTLKLDGTDLIATMSHSVTLGSGTGYTLEAASGSASPVADGGSYTFQFALAAGYSKTENFAVKVNGKAVTLQANDSYTISNITEDTTVTVEGVADITAPAISGIENGKTYCEAQTFTVTEANLATVTVNGTAVTPVDGKYTVSPAEGEQTIVVTDTAGNVSTYKITVNNGHTLKYSVQDGSKIIEACENCGNASGGHKAEAQITASDAVYEGAAVETAQVAYSSNWQGGTLEITYTNNTGAGQATASITKDGATAQAAFTISKGTQDAPTTPGAEAETIDGKADGKITGVDDTMEYRKDGETTYTAVTKDAVEVQDLADGKYYIRYAKNENYQASEDVEITVEKGRKLKVTFLADSTTVEEIEVSWNGSIAQADLPKIPEKTGYDQTPPTWSKTAADLTGIQADTTVTAQYTINTYTVPLNPGTGYTLEAVSGNPVNHGDSFTFKVIVAEGYSKTEEFKVRYGGAELAPNADGSYTISAVTGTTAPTVSGVADTTAPTGKIVVSDNTWTEFLHTITFGKFFKNTQTVEISGEDAGSGVNKIYYYISNAGMTEAEVQAVTDWTEYTKSFAIEPNEEYVIYAKLTDQAGNITYISSNGMVLDNIAPVITGIENGKTYCGAVAFTVNETYFDSVSLNGKVLQVRSSRYTIEPAKGKQTIVAADKAGNTVEITVTVNDGHTWDQGTITKKAAVGVKGEKTFTCTVCGEKKTEAIAALKAEKTKTDKDKEVKTGDTSHVIAYMTLALLSLLCIAGVNASKKKHR